MFAECVANGSRLSLGLGPELRSHDIPFVFATARKRPNVVDKAEPLGEGWKPEVADSCEIEWGLCGR